MAPFNLGSIGSLFKNLPGLGYVYGAGQAGYHAAKGQPVRGLVSGALTAGGAALEATGAGTAGTVVGIPAGAAAIAGGLGLQALSEAAGNEAQYRFNQLFGGSKKPGTDRQVGTQAVLNGKPVYWAGKDYGWQQLSGQGSSATLNALNAPGVQGRFIQDKPPGGSPADRAYHEEAINAAQQTAQNPLFQKYQVADLTKQYNEAKTPEQRENIGMQIWAQTNPTLAAKLKAGQTGYAQAQIAPGMSNAGGALINALPIPTDNFNAATAMQTPMTMSQPFGSAIPGVGMVSATPQAMSTADYSKAFTTPMDMANIYKGYALNTDPSVTNIPQDQRRWLINQYNQGLVPANKGLTFK